MKPASKQTSLQFMDATPFGRRKPATLPKTPTVDRLKQIKAREQQRKECQR